MIHEQKMATKSTPPPSKSRQPIYGKAAVSTSHPLASSSALQILAEGGTATDAAITAASVLAVTEPTFNGIGGDFISLHYDGANTEKTTAFLGIGKSPKALTPPKFMEKIPIPRGSPHTVTVPGVIAAWFDMKQRFGNPNISMLRLLTPAIRAAREGFYVQRTTASAWCEAEQFLTCVQSEGNCFIPAPCMGDKFVNEDLALVLEQIAEGGRDAFYGNDSNIANAIVKSLNEKGGVMNINDISNHETLISEPLCSEYEGWKVMEPGAPSHGAVTLLALNIIQEYFKSNKDIIEKNECDRYHIMIESIRLAFTEGCKRIGDHTNGQELTKEMACDIQLAKQLSDRMSMKQKNDITDLYNDKVTSWTGGTVQFCVIDSKGNAVSAVQTNYQGFGTGIVPEKCGFTLQNRALNFNIYDPKHVNYVQGGKRPYHTIMPGLMINEETRDIVTFGVMGSFMQPQGHLLIVRGLLEYNLNVQDVLDMCRFRVTGPFSSVEEGMGDDAVLVESDIKTQLLTQLKERGHLIKYGGMSSFGRGHVCRRRGSDGRVEAGADSRADGVALVWFE